MTEDDWVVTHGGLLITLACIVGGLLGGVIGVLLNLYA